MSSKTCIGRICEFVVVEVIDDWSWSFTITRGDMPVFGEPYPIYRHWVWIFRIYPWSTMVGWSLDQVEGSNVLWVYDRVWHDYLLMHVGCNNMWMSYWALVTIMDSGSRRLCLGFIQEFYFSPNTFISLPTKLSKIPLRELIHAGVKLNVT